MRRALAERSAFGLVNHTAAGFADSIPSRIHYHPVDPAGTASAMKTCSAQIPCSAYSGETVWSQLNDRDVLLRSRVFRELMVWTAKRLWKESATGPGPTAGRAEFAK